MSGKNEDGAQDAKRQVKDQLKRCVDSFGDFLDSLRKVLEPSVRSAPLDRCADSFRDLMESVGPSAKTADEIERSQAVYRQGKRFIEEQRTSIAPTDAAYRLAVVALHLSGGEVPTKGHWNNATKILKEANQRATGFFDARLLLDYKVSFQSLFRDGKNGYKKFGRIEGVDGLKKVVKKHFAGDLSDYPGSSHFRTAEEIARSDHFTWIEFLFFEERVVKGGDKKNP